MNRRAAKLLKKAQEYLDKSVLFEQTATGLKSTMKVLLQEHEYLLISRNSITVDDVGPKVNLYRKEIEKCEYRSIIFRRKHDRAIRKYHKLTGTVHESPGEGLRPIVFQGGLNG